MNNIKLSDNIRELRKSKGLSQEEFAKAFSKEYMSVHDTKNPEYSLKTISNWENNVMPQFDCIVVLAKMMNVRVDNLLHDELSNFDLKQEDISEKIRTIKSLNSVDKQLLLNIINRLLNKKANRYIDNNQHGVANSVLISEVFTELIYNQDEILLSEKAMGLDELTKQYFSKRNSQLLMFGTNRYLENAKTLGKGDYIDDSRLLDKFITWDYISNDSDIHNVDYCTPYRYYDYGMDKQESPIDTRKVTRFNSCLYESGVMAFEDMIGVCDIDVEYSETDLLIKKEELLCKANELISKKYSNLIANNIIAVNIIEFYEIGIFNSGFESWLKGFEDYIMISFIVNLTIDEITTLLASDIKKKLIDSSFTTKE